MKYRITEENLKAIIESNVRKVLYEEDENNKIIAQLRQPGINQAEVVRHLIQSGVWSGTDEDTGRSLFSKKVRGEIAFTKAELSAVKRSLESTIKM